MRGTVPVEVFPFCDSRKIDRVDEFIRLPQSIIKFTIRSLLKIINMISLSIILNDKQTLHAFNIISKNAFYSFNKDWHSNR